MSNAPSQLTRRQFLTTSMGGVTVLTLWPVFVMAGPSISISVFSLDSFVNVGIDIPMGSLLRRAGRFIPIVGTGLVLYGVYKIGKKIWDAVTAHDEPDSHYHEEARREDRHESTEYYATGVSQNVVPLPEPIVVVIEVEDVASGEVLRIRHSMTGLIDDSDMIKLDSGGSLHVEDDGKMRFVRSSFNGYVLNHRDGRLTVWNQTNEMVLVLTRHEQDLLILRSYTEESLTALRALVGDGHVS